MQGEMNDLKALILKDTPSTYCIHCFARQLQLTLVAAAKKHKEVENFFALIANMLNGVGPSFKRRDQLRKHQEELLEQLLESCEIQSGKGLNQEWELQRLGSNPSDRLHAKAYLIEINGFEFAFLLHLMLKVLVMSNKLSKTLQRKEQDIVNAMVFLGLIRERLQKLREEGWKEFMDEVFSFCAKHDILVPKMEEFYIPGKSKHRLSSITYSHHLHVELFYAIIDLQPQELNNCFDVVSDDLLLGMASLNPANSFANFDKERIMTLTKHYPDEFGGLTL
ncbi:uncharacterized protein LOC132639315 [Lycium barbarum]|uniref:uncharacterized protein LOC132639315 n=1 Tax=Lycium barbarum TaxID=112863 RepID=UPI00293F1CB5|nr:uncharacterized protein LOC132639315 [Lycium barbarum]